jgi:hypothetical protein
MMPTLRTVHMYLGCFFGPLLMFFALSGIWQRLKLYGSNYTLALLSTIHMSRPLKLHAGRLDTLNSPLMDGLVIVMALGLIVTSTVGILMAFRFGKRRGAVITVLVAGALLPLSLVLIQLLS